jgi:hypothetical protein
MIRKAFFTAGLLCAAAPALAQAPPPSPWAPLVDKPTCTRAELKAATDAYVAGQRKGDISALPLDPKAHFLENMATIDKDKGLWNTPLPIANAMSFHDDKRCKTFTEVIVTEGGHPYVIGTRLYLHQGKIIRVDSLVTDKGDWLFNANSYLTYTKKEDWTPVSAKTAPGEMIRGANAYLDAFSDKFTDVPWGIPCARLEGGGYTNRSNSPTASCAVGIPAGVLYIVNRDYLIDEEEGVINVFCRFGNSSSGMPDSHMFRYVDGKIHAVHTLSVNLTNTPSPQANDDGSMAGGPPPGARPPAGAAPAGAPPRAS